MQLQIIDLAEERSGVDRRGFRRCLSAGLKSKPAWITPADLEQAVRGLVDTQLQALTTLQQNLNAYFERLVELESTERQLVLGRFRL